VIVWCQAFNIDPSTRGTAISVLRNGVTLNESVDRVARRRSELLRGLTSGSARRLWRD